MTLHERLHEAFDKRVGGTAMLPASDLLSAMTTLEQLNETIAQQAEAIRVAAEQIRRCDYMLARSTLLNAPYPEILQARDEKVAEACALLCHHEAHVMSAHGDSGVEGANWCGSQIRNGGWKEYL